MKKIENVSQESKAKVKKDALRLLSFGPRSTQELRARLLRKKHDPVFVEEILAFCRREGLLDDEKFAKLYALSRIQSRPAGKKMIEMALKNRGVSEADARQALGSIEDFDEKQIALDIATRRHQRMSQLPENVSKARLYGFLKRRGFTGDSVFYALSKLYKSVEPLE